MKKILLVDDDIDIQISLCEILKRKGYLAISAYTGEMAVGLFTKERPDTVLLDINMPGISGIEVLKRLKEIDTDIPIIMITAYGTVPIAIEALTLGAYNFFTKPADMIKLLVSINNACTSLEIIRNNKKLMIQQTKMAAMGEMIGTIGHQWRQPLNAVALIVQDIGGAFKAGELDELYLKNSINSTMQQIKYMSETIEDFRNFFKPDKKKQPFDINNSIKDALGILKEQLKNNSIKVTHSCILNNKLCVLENIIKSDLYNSELYITFGYPNEFKQVVLNIINNAKDAILTTKKTGGHFLIDIDVVRVEEKIVIKIRDNGGGIPEEHLKEIFDPNFTTKGEDEGTGIGLYIAKYIIEKNMSGILSVRNNDVGAEFIIELSVVKVNS
ncbi:MAG: response regulator [Nitrospirae bacterium]|nr:response regulator [Nitrospirota bacterium]